MLLDRDVESRRGIETWNRDVESIEVERETGIEPATSSLGSLRSTAELLPQSGMCPFILAAALRRRKHHGPEGAGLADGY